MRVVFAALGQEQLGLSYLSAVLRRAGHETALAFTPSLFEDRYYFDVPALGRLFRRDDVLVEEIVAAKPDVLAFSVLTAMYPWALEIAAAVRARTGAAVVFGGVHASAVPEVCLENEQVDFVCVGEGEHAIVSLCESLARGERRPRAPIPNLWWRDDDGRVVAGPDASFIHDLDALPFADKELWEDWISIRDRYLVMTSRGCPYRCTFCFNNFFAKLPGKGGGSYVRQRSVDHVMRELVTAKRRWGLRYVDIEDDIFTLDKAWIREFAGRYRREIGAPFHCLSHPRFMDVDVARWLADAGCVHVQIGVQSADEEYKRKELLRWEDDEDLEKALDALERAKLPVKLDHILGLPGEPPSAQEKARELYARHPPRRIQTFWLSYMPGIEMTRRALEQGVLTQADVDAIDRGLARIFRHPHLEARDAGEARALEQLYRRYDLLFRMMPALPGFVRERARAEHVPDLSERAANRVGFVFDVLNSFGRLDRETVLYAKQVGEHLLRLAPEAIARARSAVPPPAKAPRILPPIHDGVAAPAARLPSPGTPRDARGRGPRLPVV